MYFFLLFIILLTAVVIHVVSEFRKKAVLSGESELSITAKNILPASKTCKICSAITFLAMIFTGGLMLAEGQETGWYMLNINEKIWKDIHIIAAVIFFISFSLHLYIHQGWIKHRVLHR